MTVIVAGRLVGAGCGVGGAAGGHSLVAGRGGLLAGSSSHQLLNMNRPDGFILYSFASIQSGAL